MGCDSGESYKENMTPSTLADEAVLASPHGQKQVADSLAGSLRTLDRKVVTVLITAAVVLTLQNYGKLPFTLEKLLAAASWLGLDSLVANARASQRSWSFTCLVWWDLVCLTTYFVLPALVVRFILKEPLHKYGIKGAGAFAGFPIYMGMLAVVMPFVILVSFGKGFQETYPFYKIPAGEPLGVDFLCWELLYAMQFVALEFFFRGFLVQGLRHRFGVDAVLVMMVPYCMIHFGKPMPETFAAIVAGIALGLMSFRMRSIWMGAMLHVTVAWSMDALVLFRQGRLM